MPHKLGEIWRPFRDEYAARLDRLQAEFEGAWADLRALLAQLDAAYGESHIGEWETGRLELLEGLLEDSGQKLLLEILGSRLKGRPQQRVLSAIEDFESGMQDLLRQLPGRVAISRRDLAETVGDRVSLSWRGRIARWQGSEKITFLRGIVRDQLQRDALLRAPADGSFQLLLARASLHLLAPWQMFRKQALQILATGRLENNQGLDEEKRWWRKQRAAYDRRAAKILRLQRQWKSGAERRLALRLLSRRRESSERARNERAEKRQRYFSYWARQQRAVQSLLELEQSLSQLELRVARQGVSSLASLDAEHASLLQELDTVIEWLEHRQSSSDGEEFPPPQANMASAYDRISEWIHFVTVESRTALPATIEVVAPSRALPGWKSPWKQLEPGREFLRALEGPGRSLAVEGFREAEASHRAIVREIERAREVVAFSRETAAEGGAAGREAAREGLANALSLLRFQKNTVTEVRPPAEASLVRGVAAAFLQCHIALEQGRLGLAAHLARQTGRRGAKQVWLLVSQVFREALHRVWKGIPQLYLWFLRKINWIGAPEPPTQPVVRTSYLGHILELQVRRADLPMIYRRLFRLAPVEDPRFLIGRESEMAGLAEAREMWESGRPASVLVVGARGSGKTSLLNCAQARVFSDLPVIRSQFRERITDAADIRYFLCGLFDLPDTADLPETLNGYGRRVVILEETERTFLRRMNGFEALRELLNTISLTWRSTLWILSTNEKAFQYLNPSANMGQFFSHRINAMSVRPGDLTSAILLRHNLSGLRLHFAPPPGGDPRVGRLRRALGLEQDAQQLFFDSLYRHSEGVFRGAFELWQHHVEWVEGGVLHMRQPVDADYQPILRSLTNDDYFTLQAVLQHGSLTTDEHSQIFGFLEENSRAMLERLRALEILEPEPAAPGLRVRPEAGRIVREALHRQNL